MTKRMFKKSLPVKQQICGDIEHNPGTSNFKLQMLQLTDL